MKYCSNCGSSKLEFKIPEHDNLKRYCCSDCGTIFYTNPNMVVGALCIRNKKSYNDYKKWCDRYFFIKHREEPRGIGGIFFDYLYNDWYKNFKFVRELGLCFLTTSKDIINNKISKKWNKKHKNDQYLKRKRYVEFNLLYDRGTKFGLNTGGNVDAIFMSFPPLN